MKKESWFDLKVFIQAQVLFSSHTYTCLAHNILERKLKALQKILWSTLIIFFMYYLLFFTFIFFYMIFFKLKIIMYVK